MRNLDDPSIAARWRHLARRLLPLLALGALAVVVVIFARGRTFYNGNTEADFLYRFLPEARRAAHLAALKVAYHPPLYPFALAAAQGLVNVWMSSALIVSGIGAILFAFASFHFFDQLCGRAAAWGSFFGLGSSVVFLAYAAQTTNDMFFFGLYGVAWLLVLLAFTGHHRWLWVLAGIATALSILARTNGIVLAPLLLAPLFQKSSRRQRLHTFAAVLIGAAIPLCLWSGYAHVTGSPLAPTAGVVDNLTLTYFPPGPRPIDRISGDAMLQVKGRFSSLWQLFSYAPGHIIAQYLIDLGNMLRSNLFDLFFPPLALLGVPGLILLWRRATSRTFMVGFALVTVSHMLLINMKAYEPRYYLFLVPPLGAGAALAGQWLWRSQRLPRLARGGAGVAFVLIVALGLRHAVLASPYQLHPWPEAQTAQIVPVLQTAPSNALIMSRVPVDPVCADRQWVFFPRVARLADLRRHLDRIAGKHPGRSIFLLYGTRENGTRRGLHFLLYAARAPAWLIPFARGQTAVPWVLYRFVPQRPAGRWQEQAGHYPSVVRLRAPPSP